MFKDLPRALAQLGDRRFLKVLGLAALITLPLFALMYWALDMGVQSWTERLAMGFDQAAGWQRWLGGLIRALDEAIALVVTVALLWFLFPPIATMVMGAFLDDVVDAVEARHYPGRLAPRALGLGEGLGLGLRSAGRLIVWNLVASPLYLVLLVTGIGPALLFLALNSYLLGRDFVEMVVVRHLGETGAVQFQKTQRPALWAVGLTTSVMFLLPVINLLAPLVGTALATHAVHRAMGDVPMGRRGLVFSGVARTLGGLAVLCMAACAPALRETPVRPPPVPNVAPGPKGLGAVIGQSDAAVLAMFAPANLDRRDGPARQLQFKRAGCIFDAYFYADSKASPMTARHVDARYLDGRNADPAACIDAQLQVLAAK